MEIEEDQIFNITTLQTTGDPLRSSHSVDLEDEDEDECATNKKKSPKIKDSPDSAGQSSIGSNSSLQRTKRKYVKQSMTKFMNRQPRFNEDLSSQLETEPIYQTIKDILPFLLIGGDFLYQLTEINRYSNSSPSSNLSMIRIGPSDHTALYKEVVEITKTDKMIGVKLINKLNGLIDFRNYIPVLNQILSGTSGESHIEMLLEFQAYIDRCYSLISKVVSLYTNQDELIALQQRRFQYIRQVGMGNFSKTFKIDEDYMIIGLAMINFQTKVPEMGNMYFNKPLVSLIGSDFDQLQSYFLRKGVKEFFDFETRLLIQSQHIKGMINKRNESFEHPFTLITYDDITIQCRIFVESVFIEMPEDLKYDQMDENPFDIHEGGFMMRLILTDEQVKLVEDFRAKQSNEIWETADRLKKEEDFCYNIQSQLLLEKFYVNELDRIQRGETTNSSMESEAISQPYEEGKQKKKRVVEFDPHSNIRCKFKPI